MKKLFFTFGLIPVIALLFNLSCQSNIQNSTKDSDITDFLGQWSFNIGEREGVPGSVGWLEVNQEGDTWDANILWGGGSITSVPYLYFNNNVLNVGRNSRRAVLERDAEDKPIKIQNIPQWLEFSVNGDEIIGYQLTPSSNYVGVDTTVIVKGKKMPALPPAPDLATLKFDKPINLIKDPNSLEGWRLLEENATNGWSMHDGILKNDPVQKEGEPHISYGNLRTDQEFEDFNLKLDVNVNERCNSGIYLRGMIEIQVSDCYNQPLNIHGTMGAVYSRILPTVNAAKPAGEWQEMDITYVDRHITVILNEVKIIDNQPVYGPTGGAMIWDVLSQGPIYLQGDHTQAFYKNIILTPIIN